MMLFPPSILSHLNPGEHPFTFQGKSGQIEAVLTIPARSRAHYMAILGHPHSLKGGTMENKVVTTLARAFKDLGIASIRMNFRGVGHSEGVFDEGIGESDDVLVLQNLCLASEPEVKFLFAGFSFGSFVTYRAACAAPPEMLISIAPPVNHFLFSSLPATVPWIIIHGEDDEVVPFSAINAFVASVAQAPRFIPFTKTGHFFHGKLIELKDTVKEIISEFLFLTEK